MSVERRYPLLKHKHVGADLTLPLAMNANGVAEPQLELWTDDTINQPNITATAHGLSGGGTFHGRQSRGTRASPTPSQLLDITGGIGSRACFQNGSFHASSPAAIHWQVTENQSPTAFGMWLRLLTTPKGATIRQERGGVTDNGTIWSHDNGTYSAADSTQTQPISDARFVASATTASSGASFLAATYGAGPLTPGFRGLNTRGTPAAPTATQLDDILVFLGGHGFGTAITSASKVLIALRAAENWSATAQGTHVDIETTTNGGTTRALRLRVQNDGFVRLGGASGPLVATGTGTPEAAVTAPVGSIFLRTDGGAATTFYVKESGVGNTGWIVK